MWQGHPRCFCSCILRCFVVFVCMPLIGAGHCLTWAPTAFGCHGSGWKRSWGCARVQQTCGAWPGGAGRHFARDCQVCAADSTCVSAAAHILLRAVPGCSHRRLIFLLLRGLPFGPLRLQHGSIVALGQGAGHGWLAEKAWCMVVFFDREGQAVYMAEVEFLSTFRGDFAVVWQGATKILCAGR